MIWNLRQVSIGDRISTAVVVFLVIVVLGCSKRRENADEERMRGDTVTQSTAGRVDSIGNKTVTPRASATLPGDSVGSEYSGLSIGELWSSYKRLRSEAEEHKRAGEFDKSIEKLLAAARCAILLNRPGIASWQYNNAGKHAIDKFMALTDYRIHVAKLNEMDNGAQKALFLKEVRGRLKTHEQVLQRAAGLFEEAKRMNFRAPEQSREEAITRNEAFVREAVSLIDNTK